MRRMFQTHPLMSGLIILCIIIGTVALLKGGFFVAPAGNDIDHTTAKHAETTNALENEKGNVKDQPGNTPQPSFSHPRGLVSRAPQDFSSGMWPDEERDPTIPDDDALLLDEQEDPEQVASLEEILQIEREVQTELGSQELPSLSDKEVDRLEAETNDRILEEDLTRDLLPDLPSDIDSPDSSVSLVE